jgi:hypothetical protein
VEPSRPSGNHHRHVDHHQQTSGERPETTASRSAATAGTSAIAMRVRASGTVAVGQKYNPIPKSVVAVIDGDVLWAFESGLRWKAIVTGACRSAAGFH